MTAHIAEPRWSTEADDLLFSAWILLCGVSDGDWSQQDAEWQARVARFRSDYFDHLMSP